jgi:Domain of unknown function (DUF4214)/Glycosyl hydrolase catalytic core
MRISSIGRSRRSAQSIGRAALQHLSTIALTLLALVAAAPASTRASDIVWGVNGHPFSAYPGVPYAQQLDLVAALGAKSYRVNVTSVDHVPYLADLIALAKLRGVQILPLLTPAVDLDKETAQVLYAKSFNFAVTIASRFRYELPVWELGNELEIYALLRPCDRRDDGTTYPCTFGIASGISPTEYSGARWKKVSAVLKGLSDGIVSVDPRLRKAMGTAGWGHLGAFDRMKNDGIAWDITVWHAYREEADAIFERLAAFKKPIWITELNLHHGSEQGGLATQADALRTMMTALRRQQERFNIEAVFIYELLDEPYWTDYEGHMGLVTQVKTPTGWTVAEKKPAFEAVRQTIAAARAVPRASCDVRDFQATAPTSQNKVAYSYCLVFQHEPDGKGLQEYARELDQGLSAQALVTTLAQSDWFSERHHPASRTDREFVSWTYQMLLGRQPDAGGFDSYVSALRKGETDRRKLVADLIASAEFRERHQTLFAPVRLPATKSN